MRLEVLLNMMAMAVALSIRSVQNLQHANVCCTMRPSRASTSLTRVPFASPPMLGLQLISPMLAVGRGVTSTVVAPRLADAAAASQPATQSQVSTYSLFVLQQRSGYHGSLAKNTTTPA